MDNLEDVEDLTFLWNFDETKDDLRMQLLHVTNELEQARKDKIRNEKINMENVKKLIYLLEITYKERDELKHQLRTISMVKVYKQQPNVSSLPMATTTTNTLITNLQNKPEQPNIGYVIGQGQTGSDVHNLIPNSTITLPTNQQPFNGLNDLSQNNNPTNFPTMSPQSPLVMANSNANLSPCKVNSSKATSSSSMDSYFDVGSFSDVSYLDNTNSSYDPSILLDNLVQGKTKPEKGKLLQSVMEAGPTLDSLLVAGSLPEWSNPPQLAYDPQLPPVPISMNKRPRHNERLEY